MRFLPGGPDIPDVLVLEQERGGIVFVCGAGVSMTAGLPSFATLVDGVYTRLGEDWRPHHTEREVMARGGRMALQVRGMMAAAAPYRVRLTLHRFGGNTFFGAYIYDDPVTDDDDVYIGIDLAVTDQSGRTIYQDTVEDARGLKTPPASRDDSTLRALVQALLSATVDRMLDNPAFRTAVQHH